MAKKRPPGRPPMLRKAADRERLLKHLRKGHSYEEACVLCGVTFPTLSNERKRDGKFDETVKAARREGRVRAKAKARGTILGAVEKEWRAALAYLERMHPDEWSKHRHVTHEGEIEVSHNADLDSLRRELLDDPDYLEFLRTSAVAEDGNTGHVRANGQPRKVEDGPPSRGHGPGAG